jgi:hypothetical protein
MEIPERHPVLRRHVVVAGLVGPLFLLLRGTRAAEAAADGSDPVKFVAALYAIDAEGKANGVASPFTPELGALWKQVGAIPWPAGVGVSAWLGRGLVLPGTWRVDTIRLLSRTPDAARVEAVVFVRSERRVITFDLVPSATSWLVANVEYPGDDLVSFLRRTIANPPGMR